MSASQPSSSSSSTALSTVQRPPATFEFAKRKRWADLLVNELADAIILVLSSSCNVLYCGAAVTEILGWRDVDLVDTDFADLVTYPDRLSFQNSFNESLRTGQNLLSYTHLKRKTTNLSNIAPPREMLFEVTGYPHFVGEEQTSRCFFAMAKPYPSRNTSMLSSFLELKMENERLQQRLAYLRANMPSSIIEAAPSRQGVAVPYELSLVPTRAMNPSNPMGNLVGAYEHTPYYNVGQTSGVFPVNPTALVSDDGEDLFRKKRLKKSHSTDQYVCITCGRTDSPEWRKGPLGPKTLCNACGLRWAKQVRRFDDVSDNAGAEAT